jgi:hypothetical protein
MISVDVCPEWGISGLTIAPAKFYWYRFLISGRKYSLKNLSTS